MEKLVDEVYELFSYNLYPGPSAKKGVYSVLIKIGEEEGWITAHSSTVKIITPYARDWTRYNSRFFISSHNSDLHHPWHRYKSRYWLEFRFAD